MLKLPSNSLPDADLNLPEMKTISPCASGGVHMYDSPAVNPSLLWLFKAFFTFVLWALTVYKPPVKINKRLVYVRAVSDFPAESGYCEETFLNI